MFLDLLLQEGIVSENVHFNSVNFLSWMGCPDDDFITVCDHTFIFWTTLSTIQDEYCETRSALPWVTTPVARPSSVVTRILYSISETKGKKARKDLYISLLSYLEGILAVDAHYFHFHSALGKTWMPEDVYEGEVYDWAEMFIRGLSLYPVAIKLARKYEFPHVHALLDLNSVGLD
jgi:hypothetical protein